jgi:hypothetical protein
LVKNGQKRSRFRLKHCLLLDRQEISKSIIISITRDARRRGPFKTMEASNGAPVVTESYGGCLITSQPKSASNMWVPYAFVVWRKDGRVQFHRFPELDNLVFSTEKEALSAGFSTGRSWADLHLKRRRRTSHKVVRLFS